MVSDKPRRTSTASRLIQWILIFSGVLGVSTSVAPSATHADQISEQKQKNIERCQAIDEKAYSTGMIFNPKGLRTMFERSRCFQDLAIGERDPALCGQVVERKSWFFDGSAISEKSCLAQVARRIEKDRQDFSLKDFRRLHRLRSAAFTRNGNGKDFNFEVPTEGSMSGAHKINLQFTSAGGGEPVSVYDETSRFADTDSRKSILLRRNLLAEKLGETFEQTEWTAAITLQFAKTPFNRFYYDAIPVTFRSSRLETRLRFADLPPWKPEPTR